MSIARKKALLQQVGTRAVAGAPLVAALCLVVAQVPAAHADPLDNLRGAVNGARAQSTCLQLNYSGQLEAAAQAWVRNAEALGSVNAPHLDISRGGYKGHASGSIASGDPTADATNSMMGNASGDIRDCSYTDFGVGMVRDEVIETSYVAVVLGKPKAPAPAQQQGPAQPTTATVVGGPVNIYNIAHDEVPDPNNGIRGLQIGTLQDGQQVTLTPGGPCARDAWCKINMPDDASRVGFVNGHLQY